MLVPLTIQRATESSITFSSGPKEYDDADIYNYGYVLNRVLYYKANTTNTDSLRNGNGHLITSKAEGWDGMINREYDVWQTSMTTAPQTYQPTNMKDYNYSDSDWN